MKKILTSLVLAALAPITTFAISLSDLTNNPERYAKVPQMGDCSTYVDNESIRILKNEPPDYTIRCLAYLCDNKKQTITEVDETADFHVSYEEDKRNPNTIRKVINGIPNRVTQKNAWTFSGMDIEERIAKDDMRYIYGWNLNVAVMHCFKVYFDNSIQISD